MSAPRSSRSRVSLRTLSCGLIALLLGLAGVALFCFGGWLVVNDVVPQVRASGWSLRETSMILNREWRGNELYLLIAIYGVVGVALVLGGGVIWRRRRA